VEEYIYIYVIVHEPPGSDISLTSLDKLLKILLNGKLKSNYTRFYKKTLTFTSFYCHTSTELH